MNRFEERIKKIELELLALKTSSLYTSIRNANTTASGTLRTGRYRINYANSTGEAIMSEAYSNKQFRASGSVTLLTPQGSSQIAEIDTTFIDPETWQPYTYDISLLIVSNVPVTSITRIS